MFISGKSFYLAQLDVIKTTDVEVYLKADAYSEDVFHANAGFPFSISQLGREHKQ